MKLFSKIFITVFVSFVAVVSLISYLISVKQISDAEGHIIEKNKILGRFLAEEIEVGHLQSKWPFESLKKLSEQKDFLFWWVVRDDGVIHLANDVAFMGTGAYFHYPQIAEITGEENVVLEPTKNYGIFIKTVSIEKKKWLFCLGFSLKEISEMKKEIILLDIGVSLLGVVILGFLLYLTIAYLTKPIKELSSGVAIIGEGNLAHRVKVLSHDELGELASSFNKMAEDLQKITVSRNELAKEITERKQAEEELKASENKYRTLLENLPQKIFYKDRNSVYVSCNDNYAQDLKIKSDEIIGKTDYDFYPKELAEKYRADDKRIMESGKTEEIEEKYIQEGKEGIVYTVKTPIKDEKGTVIGILGIFWDITERKKTEEALKNYTRQIEKVNKELDDFTYIVSHDLKEPLRSIDAFSKFIEDDYQDKLGEEGKNYIVRIRANASRMQNLIEDLLEISRIERERNPLDEVEVEELINEVKLRLEFAIKQKNVEITVQDKLPKLFCDRIRLAEVFLNLISNAIKFNDKPNPKIDIGCREKDNFYEFYVKDNGPGIEEQYFDKIFEIFQRLGKIEEYEGIGAGLTIAKKIVQMHKGKIWVESKVGEGATFYFSIPKKKDFILGKKKLGEILVEKKLIDEEEIRKALEEQEKMS